jgi:ribosomal protein L6P/L9E
LWLKTVTLCGNEFRQDLKKEVIKADVGTSSTVAIKMFSSIKKDSETT